MSKPVVANDTPWTAALRLGWRALSPAWLIVLGVPAIAALGAALGAVIGALLDAGWAGAAAGAGAALLVAPLAAAAALLLGRAVPAAAPAAAVSLTAEDSSAIRDALTGAFTQRHFIAAADREWARIRRHGEDAALLMIDADHLRAINERHGNDCGDVVLVQITRLANATLRQYDLLARFNAGVLVVFLPQTDPIGAIDVAERIRDRIASYRINWSTGPVSATVSIGVASIGAEHAALDSVITDAGAALREAKGAGRNCVRAAPVQPRVSPSSGASRGDRRMTGPR